MLNTKVFSFQPWESNRNGDRVVADEAEWKRIASLNQEAKEIGMRYPVLCTTSTDLFEESDDRVFLSNGDVAGIECAGGAMMEIGVRHVRRRLFGLIDLTPNLLWLITTKFTHNIDSMTPPVWRIDRGKSWLGMEDCDTIRPNVWFGTIVENQEQADERIPELLEVKATGRFVVCGWRVDMRPKGPDQYSMLEHYSSKMADPSKLGRIDGTDRVLNCFPKIDWVTCDGAGEWVDDMQNHCQAAGVKFASSVKQFLVNLLVPSTPTNLKGEISNG